MAYFLRLRSRGDHWVLPCEGLEVDQVRIDYAYGLEFTQTPERAIDDPWRLRVNTPMTVRLPDGRTFEVDPEGPAEDLGPALVARNQLLVRGDVWKNGRIELEFADGTTIEVPPNRHYEAWHLQQEKDPMAGFISPLVPDEVDWGE